MKHIDPYKILNDRFKLRDRRLINPPADPCKNVTKRKPCLRHRDSSIIPSPEHTPKNSYNNSVSCKGTTHQTLLPGNYTTSTTVMQKPSPSAKKHQKIPYPKKVVRALNPAPNS